eukprot:scpid22006/ scgid20446/ SCAN domain-containing protein 3; Protein ZNF452
MDSEDLSEEDNYFEESSDDGSTPEREVVDISGSSDDGAPPAKRLRLQVPRCVEQWQGTYDWLGVEESKGTIVLFCKLCRLHGKVARGGNKVDAWIDGTSRHRLSGVTDHLKSKMHEASKVIEKTAVGVKEKGGGSLPTMQRRALLKATSAKDQAVLKLLKALYWLSKENIAMDKWHGMTNELYDVLGVDVSAARRARDALYTSTVARDEFLEALHGVLLQRVKAKVAQCTFMSVVADESTDVSNVSQLVLHLRLVKDGDVDVLFGGIVPLLEGCSANNLVTAIKNWAREAGVDLAKCHLGSDGASTFAGRINGVAAQLQREYPLMKWIHCVAHREALAASDAISQVPYLKTVF